MEREFLSFIPCAVKPLPSCLGNLHGEDVKSVQVWVARTWLVSRCFHQLGSKACAWGYAVSTAVLVSLILVITTSRKDPVSKSYIRATKAQAGSGFGKHQDMMDAPKLLISQLYQASAHPSEMPGWRHCETKKPSRAFLLSAACRCHPSASAGR